MAPLVVSQANGESSTVGSLFNGLAFFVLQKVPSRTHYLDLLKANGGRVVKTEGQADHVIADEFRKDAPAGSISYSFIDTAVKDGKLPDPVDHPAGPPVGALREVGSITIPGKMTRTPFTAEDDKVLWQWVERSRQEGGSVKGNEIYKQLEARNSRHTYQAWRDRYIKKLMNKPPAGVQVTVAANAPPSPPAVPVEEEEVDPEHGQEKEPNEEGTKEEGATEDVMTDADGVEFTPEDFDNLMGNAADIMKIDRERGDEAWSAWASSFESHSADAWRVYWEEKVRPMYLEKRAARRRKRNSSLEERATPSKRKRSSTTPKSAGVEDEDVAEVPKPNSEPRRKEVKQSIPKATNPNEPIEIPSDNEDAEALATIEEPFQTSEANRAAEAQLQKDMSLPPPVTDNANTTEQQVQPMSEVEPDDEIMEDDGGDVTISNHLIEDGEVEDGLPGEDVLDDAILGDALTEANLATREEQNRPQPTRGIDIPEDDPNKDQGSYADYLRGLTGQMPGQQPPLGNQELVPEMQLPQLSEPVLDDTMYTHNDGHLFSDLPMSSQQELDDAFQANLDWPSSPQQMQRTPVASQAQAQRAQTEIEYSQLHNDSIEEVSNEMFTEQPLEPEVEYPDLPVAIEADVLIEPEQARDLQEPSINAIVERNDFRVGEEDKDHDDEDDELDLSVPEPEGRFDMSPLPTRKATAVEQQDALHTQPQDNAPKLARQLLGRADVMAEQNVIEVSSAEDPSSSFEESSPESSPPPYSNKAGNRALETQDILNAETQQPDLEVPLPPDSDEEDEDENDEGLEDDDLPSDVLKPTASAQKASQRKLQSLARAPIQPPGATKATFKTKAPKRRSPQKTIESQSSTEALDLDTYIPTICLRYKVDEGAVITALKATSMRPDPAELVMLELKAGRGLPKDVPGVWSEEEDVVIEGGDARKMNVVVAKHGWDEVHARLEFLTEWRAG